jgi:hypothetical protein
VRGLRVVPALCGGATVVLAGALTRALGGGRWAEILAALCVAVAPEFLATCHFLSMNCVLPVAWTFAALAVVRGLEGDDARPWVAAGVALGLGLLAKHSTLFFGAGLAAGLLATRASTLRTRGPWIAVGVAALLFLPNVLWEATHGWATLEFMRNAQEKKMVHMGALAFVRSEVDDMLPFAFPVWAAGLAWLFVAGRGRAWRFFGVTFVVTAVIVVAGGGKPYYLAPAFPLLFAAGGVAIEERLRRPVVRGAVTGALALGGVAIAPMTLPILDEPTFVRYAAALGSSPAPNEKHASGALPQFQADQHGWEAMAARVGAAYERLSPEEKKVASVYGGNYGEAGTLDFFGARWGLPPAVSGHNNYALWGPPQGGRGAVLIAVADGAECDDWSNLYERVEEVDRTDDPYAMPYEDHLAICVLRGVKEPLEHAWPRLRHFI